MDYMQTKLFKHLCDDCLIYPYKFSPSLEPTNMKKRRAIWLSYSRGAFQSNGRQFRQLYSYLLYRRADRADLRLLFRDFVVQESPPRTRSRWRQGRRGHGGGLGECRAVALHY